MAAAASTAREVGTLDRVHFSPAEAEPWGDDGGGLETPAARPTWFRRTRDRINTSVWAPLALRLVALVLGILALSGVGFASLLDSASGVHVPLASMLGANVRAPWLAPEHVPTRASVSVSVSASADARGPAGTEPGGARAGVPAPNPNTAGAVPAVTAEQTTPASPPNGASPGMTTDGKVILNLASVEDLRHLPGVGPKRADAIVLLRSRLGRFKQVNDLLRVKGIGVRGLRKLMPHVVLDAPKPAV